MPAPLSGSKRKREHYGLTSGKTAPRAKLEKEPDRGDDDGSIQSDGDAAGFAAVFDKVMARNITQSATVMAKRHTAAAKHAEVMKKEHAQERKTRKERKEAKRIRLVVPSISTADNEKELRRLATKGGTIALQAYTTGAPCTKRRHILQLSRCSMPSRSTRRLFRVHRTGPTPHQLPLPYVGPPQLQPRSWTS
jgi:hypothetical protein